MKLGVFGAGYVGLVSAAGFAEFGHTVCCGDVNKSSIESLQDGSIPFSEPNLHELVARQTQSGRLSFTNDLNELVEFADVLVVAVGTPSKQNGEADITSVNEVANLIARKMESDKVVVIKSTVPPGTCRAVEVTISDELSKRNANLKVSVISNPEFLREGSALDDFLHPDRIIVGLNNRVDESILKSLYAPLTRDQLKIIFMSRESAELTKYAANAMLATRISFMNEMARLAEKVDADIQSVELGIGSDKRVGPEFLSAGIGFGGSCFPKDLKSLSNIGAKWSIPMYIVDATLKVNSQQRHVLVEKARTHFKVLSGLRCAVWGLSFKPETDDIRDSPALEVIRLLLDAGVDVSAFDPVVKQVSSLNSHSFDRCHLVEDAYVALKDVDMLFLLTDWREFMSPDFRRMFETMRQPVVFDGRNIWNPQALKSRGFTYYGIGRAT
ncbi:MAG: UDP-glucose dehydrogenase family protein [Acidimicrobiaceae bacterium]